MANLPEVKYTSVSKVSPIFCQYIGNFMFKEEGERNEGRNVHTYFFCRNGFDTELQFVVVHKCPLNGDYGIGFHASVARFEHTRRKGALKI